MTFETKDSGERAVFDSGMQRDTESGKPRFDLLIPEGVPFDDQLLTRFAALMARGAEKYTERNWEQATGDAELVRFKSSAFRHFMQWFCGERDEDHAAATLFNMMGFEATEFKMKDSLDASVLFDAPPAYPVIMNRLVIGNNVEWPEGPPSVRCADTIARDEANAPGPESFCLLDSEGDWWAEIFPGGWGLVYGEHWGLASRDSAEDVIRTYGLFNECDGSSDDLTAPLEPASRRPPLIARAEMLRGILDKNDGFTGPTDLKD